MSRRHPRIGHFQLQQARPDSITNRIAIRSSSFTSPDGDGAVLPQRMPGGGRKRVLTLKDSKQVGVPGELVLLAQGLAGTGLGLNRGPHRRTRCLYHPAFAILSARAD